MKETMNILEAVKAMRAGKVVRRKEYPEERWKILDRPRFGEIVIKWWDDDMMELEYLNCEEAFHLLHFDAEWEVVEE